MQVKKYSSIQRLISNEIIFRCDSGWTNGDCSLSLIQFPNEINILKHDYYTNYGAMDNKKCGTIFNNV